MSTSCWCSLAKLLKMKLVLDWILRILYIVFLKRYFTIIRNSSPSRTFLSPLPSLMQIDSPYVTWSLYTHLWTTAVPHRISRTTCASISEGLGCSLLGFILGALLIDILCSSSLCLLMNCLLVVQLTKFLKRVCWFLQVMPLDSRLMPSFLLTWWMASLISSRPRGEVTKRQLERKTALLTLPYWQCTYILVLLLRAVYISRMASMSSQKGRLLQYSKFKCLSWPCFLRSAMALPKPSQYSYSLMFHMMQGEVPMCYEIWSKLLVWGKSRWKMLGRIYVMGMGGRILSLSLLQLFARPETSLEGDRLCSTELKENISNIYKDQDG